jgi:Autophagocytosis associated protein, active-site domain
MSGFTASDSAAEPFFSPVQFREACVALADSFRRVGTEARWTPTPAPTQHRLSEKSTEGYLLIRETFPCPSEPAREIRIDYHVLLSETWQVPVLYFAPLWNDTLEPLALKEVYAFIVEKSSKDAVEDVGVMGGISHGVSFLIFQMLTQDHPILGTPHYFIHPCRTADLLQDIQKDNKEISHEQLLQVWLGLVGGVVNIPALTTSL